MTRRCSACGGEGHNSRTCPGPPGGALVAPTPPIAPRKEDGARIWPRDVLACLDAMEFPLKARGIEPMTPWWRTVIASFYASGKKQLVARVGRRGRKSYTWCIVAVAEILSGRHTVPPGDTGIVSIVSADRSQAEDRIATCIAILDALGIDHKKTTKGIEFPDRPYRISVLTASVRAVSSYTCIMALGDEVAKWTEGDTKVNPARAVIGSWRATLLTQQASKMILLSSPMGFEDEHAQAFDRGDTRQQMVCYAPTWVANPSVTEEMCRIESEAERDPEIWFRRECKAEPQSSDDDDAGITVAKVERAISVPREREDGHEYQAAIYACPRMNEWALMVATRRRGDDGEVRSAVVHVQRWPSQVDVRTLMREVREVLARYELIWARTPLNEFAKETVRRARPLGVVPDDVTNEMHESLRVRFSSDGIEIPDSPELRSDLLAQHKRVTLTTTSYEARRFAVLMALLASKCLNDPPPPPVHIEHNLAWWQDQQARKLAHDMRAEELEGYRLQREKNEMRDSVDWLADIRRHFGYE